MRVDLLVTEFINEPMPFITLVSLALIERDEPASSPAQARDAQEAQRLMGLSTFTDAAAPIARETDSRIVLTEIDRLVQEMVGWRELPEIAPGLPVLVIPPRLFPDGWDEIKGVIQKKPLLAIDNFWPSHHFAFYENVVHPRWIEEERERMSRTAFADEYLCQPISQCPDGHKTSGKN